MSNITSINPSELSADERVSMIAELKEIYGKFPVSSPLSRLIRELINAVDTGSRFTGIVEDQELSPNEAAALLGVSRPHLMDKYVRTGVLNARKEKSHYRIKSSDIMDFIHRRDQAARDVAEALATPTRIGTTDALTEEELAELDDL